MTTPAPHAPHTSSPSDAHNDSGCCSNCGDDHAHQGPTGAEIVQRLGTGFAVLALVTPLLAIVLVLIGLTNTPLSFMPPVVGLALGGVQLFIAVGISVLAGRIHLKRHGNRDGTQRSISVVGHPAGTAVRSVLEELARLGAVSLVLVLHPVLNRAATGLWIGIGASVVWAVLATAQFVSARRRIQTPSEWSRETVQTVLDQGGRVGRVMGMRVIDLIGVFAFQIGASLLIAGGWVMVVATAVLSMATGLSILIMQQRSPADRPRSIWAFAPVGIGVFTVVLAIIFVLLPLSVTG
ncbi:hypothetical protein [Devriesea agamarum]|uniref:hypothetical protein n=1 Tax=Devriesea agamarum TaxID=472569 RepID=UPI00071CC4EB|nr:hypothetical protein [Devriesea agamarum]